MSLDRDGTREASQESVWLSLLAKNSKQGFPMINMFRFCADNILQNEMCTAIIVITVNAILSRKGAPDTGYKTM